MPSYVALVRAVNLGAKSSIPKATLASMFEDAGCTAVRTYIASGNVVFSSRAGSRAITGKIERKLEDFFGRPGRVHIRTTAEMAAVVDGNPFPDRPPNRVLVVFLDVSPPDDVLKTARGRRDEEIRAGTRELYVYYPGGSGTSKLVIPCARDGTARNMNTVRKLAEMSAEEV